MLKAGQSGRPSRLAILIEPYGAMAGEYIYSRPSVLVIRFYRVIVNFIKLFKLDRGRGGESNLEHKLFCHF